MPCHHPRHRGRYRRGGPETAGGTLLSADTARGRSVEGTGIGLSLVRGLVELQQGSMSIASKLDRGTTVAITLPASLADAPVEHSLADLLDSPYVVEAGQWLVSPPTEVGPSEGDRELVLIADDNADMRAHLERVLSVHWRTVLVADGEAGLRTARELRPDAIVTDAMMPKLDGFDFVSAVRRDPELAAVPILMLRPAPATKRSARATPAARTTTCPNRFARRSWSSGSRRGCRQPPANAWVSNSAKPSFGGPQPPPNSMLRCRLPIRSPESPRHCWPRRSAPAMPTSS